MFRMDFSSRWVSMCTCPAATHPKWATRMKRPKSIVANGEGIYARVILPLSSLSSLYDTHAPTFYGRPGAPVSHCVTRVIVILVTLLACISFNAVQSTIPPSRTWMSSITFVCTNLPQIPNLQTVETWTQKYHKPLRVLSPL